MLEALLFLSQVPSADRLSLAFQRLRAHPNSYAGDELRAADVPAPEWQQSQPPQLPGHFDRTGGRRNSATPKYDTNCVKHPLTYDEL